MLLPNTNAGSLVKAASNRYASSLCVSRLRLSTGPSIVLRDNPPTIVSHDHIVIDELVAKRSRGVRIAVSTRQDQEHRTRSGHAVEEGGASDVKRTFVRRAHCPVINCWAASACQRICARVSIHRPLCEISQ
jgi:hypothetical protein